MCSSAFKTHDPTPTADDTMIETSCPPHTQNRDEEREKKEKKKVIKYWIACVG